jgi:prepilin-type N-terminal cleavage/methylation domain-containing protein
MKIKTSSPYPLRRGFTLTELLVVIAIIGILAGMLLPVLVKGKVAAQKMKAKTEMADIVNAIQAYDTDYGRFPISTNEQAAAYSKGNNDFTCGLIMYPQGGSSIQWPSGPGGNYSYDNNSNVVSILMDLTAFPSGVPTPANNNHQKNPKQVKYLNAKLSGYDPSTQQLNPPGGVDNNGIYRDPWGNPYIITMDLSYDEQCSDLFYCQQKVSQSSGQSGYNSLVNVTDNGGNGDHFLYHGKVMVWSAGPDGKMDSTAAANAGFNKDNVLSW